MSRTRYGQAIAAAPLVLAAACMAGARDAAAQLRPPPARSVEAYALAPAASGAGEPAAAATDETRQADRPTPEQLRLRNAAVIGGGILLVGAFGAAKWWDEGFTGEFRTQKEGWFGQNTPYGGADKLGHAFSCTRARDWLPMHSKPSATSRNPRAGSRHGPRSAS